MRTPAQLAAAVTRELRTIWPKPITLRSKSSQYGEIEITVGCGGRRYADQLGARLARAIGEDKPLVFRGVTELRGGHNIRIKYTPAWLPVDEPLAGPPLVEVPSERGPHYTSEDGLDVWQQSDGTWRAYGWATGYVKGDRNRLSTELACANKATLAGTYWFINRWRERLAERREADHAEALVDDAHITLDRARAAAAAADLAYRAAITAGQPAGREALHVQTANIAVGRAYLALRLARGWAAATTRFSITSVSYGDDQWEITHWGTTEAQAGETPTDHAHRHATEAGLISRTMRPKVWRVQIFSDPMATSPAGEWTNLTKPCAPGEHRADGHPISSGVHRRDGSRIEHVRCAGCFHPVWRIMPYRLSDVVAASSWVLEGEPLPEVAAGIVTMPLECVTDDHHGMQINNGLGQWYTLRAVGDRDDEGRCQVSVDGRDPVSMPSTMTVQLRPGPIVHDGAAVDAAGEPLGRHVGVLYYDLSDGDRVGTWHLSGVGYNSGITSWDLPGAQDWAARELAESGHGTVIGWEHHQDQYGDMWRAVFPGGGPSPNGNSSDFDRSTPTGSTDPAGPSTTSPSPVAAAVRIGFRIEVRTDGEWDVARTGQTDPLPCPDRASLTGHAQTIFGNARQVLGLDATAAMPAVRVRTWLPQSGITVAVDAPEPLWG